MPSTHIPSRPSPVEIGPVRASTMKRWRDRDGEIEWYWRARIKGDRATVWSGWGTRDQVQQALAELVAEGPPQPRKVTVQATAQTVGDLMDQWTEYQQQRPNLSPYTLRHYEFSARHLATWLRPTLSTKVDRRVVERYRDDRLREGAAPRLVVQELKIFRMAWRWGSECGLAPSRDLACVQVKVDGFVLNHRTPDPTELAAVLQHLQGDVRLAVRLLSVTGARVSEVCGRRRSDLDPRTGLLTFEGKTGRRDFPLPRDMVALFADRLDRTDQPLLSLPPGIRGPKCIRHHLARACKAAGINRFTPHGLRRMVVDRMARSGVDVATAASLTGHSVEVMLRFYRNVTDDDRRRAVAQAQLGHLPVAGDVIQGPWPEAATQASGTHPGHTRRN